VAKDAAPSLTTEVTVERGPVGPGGWRELQVGPAEAYQDDLPDGEVLGCIWHLSDVHVCDAESPARLEYLDRYSDPDSPYRDDLGDIGTYRPQEAMTVQVAVAMVQTVNAHLAGPVTGAPVDTVLVTGDLTDNAQRNELSWYQQALEGGTISPRSGDPDRSSWVGVSDLHSWDERYWHPDGAPEGVAADLPTRLFGYPSIPGLVEAVRRDVESPGLALPWISVYGNHDGLLQGTVAPDDALRALAVGEARITGLPAGADPMLTAEAIAADGPARYIHDETSPRTRIAPDPARDFVSTAEFARTTRQSRAADTTYFTADAGRLRVIALDTINPHGGWQGSLGLTQYEWLVDQLEQSRDRYVVITSHHPSPTLTNDYAPGNAEPRVLGGDLLALLTSQPQVIAWLAGHVHFHAALRHESAGHAFVELTTASLIDWPQQGRILEFVRVAGEVAIVSTVMDHCAPPAWSPAALDDPINLASISRALAANDYRLREGSLRGLRLDSDADVRNVVWRVPDPFA
jgi:metallophosphoesterase (TIGR03767 family)